LEKHGHYNHEKKLKIELLSVLFTNSENIADNTLKLVMIEILLYWWRKPEYQEITTGHKQYLSYKVVSSTHCYRQDSNIVL